MPKFLTIASQIMCPHGGQAILSNSNSKVRAGGAFVLLQADIHSVAGCPFMIGTKPSPCIKIEWSAGASKTKAASGKPLLQSSIGTCYSPENAPQGVAMIVNTQIKAGSI
jgi:hypothetical protein